VMNAAPDGQTLLIMSDPGWVGYYYTGLFDFKPWETMTPIAQVSQSPYTVLTTSGRGGLDSWQKVVARARATSAPLKGGAPAAGGFSEMTFNELVRRLGVPGIFVPYAGAGQAKVALLAGDIDFQIESGQAFQDIRSGQTHGVAISTAQRYRFAPDIPTFAELGIMDTLPTNTYSVWGPARMDPALVRMIANALKTATQDPAAVQLLEERNAIEVRWRPGAEVRDFVEQIDRTWSGRLAAVKPPSGASQ
jgi:tripartite-type tricarboxylate transporter receptor subunit TctC